jgi:hypothetical protein
MRDNLQEMSAKDFIDVLMPQPLLEVDEEIDRRILELESLKTDMAMMKIAIADLEALNEKLENTINGLV